ncbi:glycosyltransferase family 2 protein, partial [Duncaniella muris]
MFEIQFTPIIIALLCGVCVCFFYLLLGFRHYVRIVGRAASTDNTAEETDDTQLPGVSVIVCAEDDARNLETLLPAILDQDYPAPFEVIVVNDGALPSTKEVIARL